MIKKIFIIAGEASGDLWGAPIVKALIKKGIKVKGLGGDEMKSAGLKSIASIKPLSIMGIFEVIKNLSSVYKIYKKTMLEIEKFKPDVIFTIDSPGFNFRIAKAVKKLNPKIKKIHFVAPQVWAWKEERAKKIAKIFDHLLCLFPFEKKYFTPHGLKTSFVGHPVIESGVEKGNADNFRKKHNLKNATIVSIIPGSRISEIERMLPVLLKTAKTLSLAFPQIRFFIPVVSATRQFIKSALQQVDFPIKTIDGNAGNRYNLFSASKLAIATSGSVSLELGLAKVPHCICYKFNFFTHWIGKRLIKTKFANLFNIASNRELVPEFIQNNCTSEILSHYAFSLLSEKKKYDLAKKNLEFGVQKLFVSKNSPSKKIVKFILEK